jgi:hypothetical protein
LAAARDGDFDILLAEALTAFRAIRKISLAYKRLS